MSAKSPMIITRAEFAEMPADLKAEFQWIPKYGGPPWDQILTGYQKGQSWVAIRAAKEARWAFIRATPEIKITKEEFAELPADLHVFTWQPIWHHCQHDGNYLTGYQKGPTLAEIQAAKEARWAHIAASPQIKISAVEYAGLPAHLKALTWDACWEHNQHDGSYLTGYQKGIPPAQVAAQKAARWEEIRRA